MLAKTSRPRLFAVYQRSRLFEQLDLARQQHSATFIAAAPGAGKTTLISSYIEFRNLHCLWYQVDSSDDDVATFFHYFSQAAEKNLPDRACPLPDFDLGLATHLTRFSQQYFRVFYAQAETPLVVVLDNYHELPDESAMHDAVRVACAEAPEHCHIVIASREEAPARLTGARLNRGLTTIASHELALTLQETHGVAKLHGLILPSEAAAASLHARSAGWMMGLVLLLDRNGRNTNDLQSNVSLWQEPEELLFNYFAGEVFEKLDADRRDLLMQSALLPRMTADRVASLTGTAKAGALLRDCMRRNYFVARHTGDEAVYQFHPLFREFLLNQGVARYANADLATLRCNAAEILISHGDAEASIELLEQAGSWRRMGEVIVSLAPALKMQGRDATIDGWINKLPADVVMGDPWLLYWHGSSKAFSDSARSQDILETAYASFITRHDLQGMALSWAGVIDSIFNINRDFRQLDRWITEFNLRLGNRLDQLPPPIANRVTVAVFIALSFREPLHGDMSLWSNRVREILDSEVGTAENPNLRYHLVAYHLLRGEHAAAESVISMLRYASDLPVAERPPRMLVDHISEALVAMHVGMAERCLQAVSDGLRAAAATGNRLFDSVLLQLGAAMSLNRGDLAKADAFLRAFERLAEELPSLDCGAYHGVAAWRQFYAGEPTLALQLLEKAVAGSEARGTSYYIATDNLGLGLLLHLCGKTAEAVKHLEIGHQVGAALSNHLIEYAYHLFSAFVALDSGKQDKALRHLEHGLRVGRRHTYMHFFFFPPRVIARLCFTALEAGIEIAYVQALIERNELTPDPAWPQAESWPWPVRIYTLGRFSVVKAGVPLRFGAKAQKKPLELLRALIACGGRDVPEGKLADALWPDAEGDAAAQALASTLFRLRKLLGDNVIRRQESRLTLNSTVCWVDCWAFQRLLQATSGDLAARRVKLVKLYQGPFLREDEAPWAQPMRQRLHAQFIQLTGTRIAVALAVAVVTLSAIGGDAIAGSGW